MGKDVPSTSYPENKYRLDRAVKRWDNWAFLGGYVADVTLKLAEEHVSKPKSEQSRILDEEIEKFSQYMATLGDWKAKGHLISQERALIKTYLIYKLKEGI